MRGKKLLHKTGKNFMANKIFIPAAGWVAEFWSTAALHAKNMAQRRRAAAGYLCASCIIACI
jgi:hypothetical protein